MIVWRQSIWLALVALCWVGAVAAAGENRLQTLATRIDTHLDAPRFATARWGVKVVSLDSGAVLYERAADSLFTPASVAKLFTAALALETFGADHRIATSVYARGNIGPDGELRGPLFLLGYGDPTLGRDDNATWADSLAADVQKSGIRSIRGDLIADARWFASPRFGSGWEAADLQSAFAAPATAISVDENQVRVDISPGSQIGAKAKITFSPEASAPPLQHHLSTIAAGGLNDVNLYRAPGDARVYAFGGLPLNATKASYRMAVSDPALMAAAQLQDALQRQGIIVQGKVRSLYWPMRDSSDDEAGHGRRIATIFSPPVSDIVRRGLKVSQNLYMQNLLLMVGAQQALTGEKERSFRSTETYGTDALAAYLAKIGVADGSVLLEDGAGLSRRNLLSADALARLLVHLGSGPAAAPFRLGLPIAGVDGSLRARMRKTAAEGRVHAKTGYMSYTFSLAGYASSASNERLAFVLLLNNYAPAAGAARGSAELDAIAVMLAALEERSESLQVPTTTVTTLP